MKRYSTIVAVILLASSAFAFAASGNGPGTSATVTPTPAQPMQQNMFGQPDISGDGINNATQVDNPADIGNKSTTASDSPVPAPTVGDVGVQNAK